MTEENVGAVRRPHTIAFTKCFSAETVGLVAELSDAEADRLEDEEEASPVPSVRERYVRWQAAAGAARAVRPVRLPGHPGAYAVFAASAPV